jgi:nicotinate-nucleotide--dimethylbenzimidazole phosphoribosyltransferase
MSIFENTLKAIKPIDKALNDKAQERLDSLTKPKGSLGRLEELAARLVSMTGELSPEINNKKVFVFAGDHGVADEGVSAFPKEVTPQMVINFLHGGAGINVLANHVGAMVIPVDIGVDFDFKALGDIAAALVDSKVVHGTKNIRKGPAMTLAETIACVEVGIELALEHAEEGAMFGTGDMGIANTTASSAIAAAFSGRPVSEVTGRGTGIDDASLKHKIEVIEDALKINAPDPEDPIDVLSKVGGAEIAGITGLIIGAASKRIPVVIDGFISTAGALVAARLSPHIAGYLIAAHRSVEKGHGVMLEMIGVKPLLDLDMRLGEGTGSALAMNLVEAGVKIYNEMATFEDAGVSEES